MLRFNGIQTDGMSSDRTKLESWIQESPPIPRLGPLSLIKINKFRTSLDHYSNWPN